MQGLYPIQAQNRRKKIEKLNITLCISVIYSVLVWTESFPSTVDNCLFADTVERPAAPCTHAVPPAD